MKDLEGGFGEEKKMCNKEIFVVFRVFLGAIWSGFTRFIFFTQIIKEKSRSYFYAPHQRINNGKITQIKW